MKDVDAVRKLLQWETQRMKIEFRRDMIWFAKRFTLIVVVLVATFWLDHWLMGRLVQ